MVLGHVSVTAAGRELLRERLPALRASLPLLLVGAVLPDLVDKPLNRIVGLSGRGYAHSLVVQVALFGVLWLLLPSRRHVLSPVWLGASLHLLEDWVDPAVLLAPLLGPVPQAPQWGFFESLLHFYGGGGPLVWLEVLGAGYWLFRGAAYLRTRPSG